MNPYDVIKTVRLSEKATILGEKLNTYVFIVDPRATKPEIRRAVEVCFGKKVKKVNTMNYDGKIRRRGGAPPGKTARFKKAYVKLHAGEKIDFT
jgi:large subunit ribosomal protein L23